MYTIEERIRYSEVDYTDHLNLTGIVNYFQDCSTLHSEDLGLGIEYLQERGHAWILSSWQIVVERYPQANEWIRVSTWPTQFERLYGIRNFTMETADKEMLAYANSIWVYMDMKTGRPTKPSEEMIERYGLEEPFDMEYAPRKIRAPKEWEELPSFPVRKCYIDTNRHMNNGKYVEAALEYCEAPEKIRQLRVEYKRSAVMGDQICPKKATEGNRQYINLCNSGGDTYAMIEFTGEE